MTLKSILNTWVKYQTKNDSLAYIAHIFYVPKLKSNLLSMRQLIEKDYEINMKNNICKIEDDKS